MPLFSYQYRNGNTTLTHGYPLSMRDLAEAMAIAVTSIRDMATNLTDEVITGTLETVDEDGDVVASLPINETISRH